MMMEGSKYIVVVVFTPLKVKAKCELFLLIASS